MNLTLNLSPVRLDKATTAAVNGTVLIVNDTSYDLSELPDGATAQHPELGKVTRSGSNYECTITLAWGPNAPEETRFPEPILLTDHNGAIELPPYDIEKEVTE